MGQLCKQAPAVVPSSSQVVRLTDQYASYGWAPY